MLRHQDVWLFAGLFSTVSISFVLTQAAPGWNNYLLCFGLLVLVQLPVLLFEWWKPALQQRLSSKKYLVYWLACFGVYLPGSTLLVTSLQPTALITDFIAAAAIGSFTLELLLVCNHYFRKKVSRNRWLQRLSIEKAILISITLLSVILGAMAVSSMDNPVYHTEGHLLIGFEFNIGKVIQHFGAFLSFSAQFLLMYLGGYLFFYINQHFLVSAILKQYGLLMYVLSMLAVIALLYPVVTQGLIALPINDILGGVFSENAFKLENGFAALTIVLISLPIVLAVRWFRQNNQIMSLEKEKSQAELDLLKQHINPHFFFNTLNNLYSLSLQKSDQALESILQLSELMRYVIYKGQEAQVTIGEEVKYIEDYLQLQQLRIRKPLNLRFEKNITDDQLPMAPLLLIILVENAFKHGVEPTEHTAFLHLQLNCTQQQYYFSCENSVEPGLSSTGGIGLHNLQRRLALLYPGKHHFTTTVKNHTFKAELQLDFS